MTNKANCYAVQYRVKKQGRKKAGEWKTESWVPMQVIDGENGEKYTMGHRIYLGALIADWHVERINWSGTLEARKVPVFSKHFSDIQGERIEFQAYYATEEIGD